VLERFRKRRAFGYAGLAIAAAGGTFTVSTVSEKARELDAERRRVDELRDKASEQDHALRGLESRLEDLEAQQQRERRRNVLEEKKLLDEIERLRGHEMAQTAQQVAAIEGRVQLLRELADRAQLEEEARRVDIRLIHRELVEPTVRVNAKSEVGSGSVVFSKMRGGKVRTFVLTAWHIVKDNVAETTPSPIEVDVYDATGKPRETRSVLVARNENLDLALLEIEDEKAPAVTARLARPQDVARATVFSKVWAIGCPLGYAPMPTSGDLTSLGKELDGITYWMTNAPTIFGNSGGGIYLAETRQLVGVLSRISAYKNLIDVAVPHMGIVTPIPLVYDWLDTTDFAFIHKEGLEPESSLLNASHPTNR
jgi:S1-C subfamily serine protease